MTSQLNVDTIVDKAGSGGTNVKVANTSTYVSDGGAVTQNTVQGMIKAWGQISSDATPAINDSFNLSSVTDTAVGQRTMNFANSFSNTSYAVGACDSASGAVASASHMQLASAATGTLLLRTFNNGDYADTFLTYLISGDLA